VDELEKLAEPVRKNEYGQYLLALRNEPQHVLEAPEL
jgi:hypothetical protein